MLDTLLHEEFIQNPKSDIELVKSYKRRFLEIQREYHEKKQRELDEKNKEDKEDKVKDNKPLTDIEQAKENKRRVEEIQAKYFLAKYDTAKAQANKIRVAKMIEEHKEQKSDIEYVKECKRRYEQIRTEYDFNKDSSKPSFKEFKTQCANQKSDLQYVKECKKRYAEIQSEFHLQKTDLQYVKECKMRYAEIQAEGKKKNELKLSLSLSMPNCRISNPLIPPLPNIKQQNNVTPAIVSEKNTLVIANLDKSSLNVEKEDCTNVFISNCSSLTIDLTQKINLFSIEKSKTINITFLKDIKGKVLIRNSSNVSLFLLSKQSLYATEFDFDRSHNININIKEG